jgi:hypothetical protein
MKQPPTRSIGGCKHWQPIYKPGSVGILSYPGRSFLYEHGHPYSLAAYPRCLDRGGRLSPHIWPCSSRGLPCRSCRHERGGLLPHRFTLATGGGGLFSVALSVVCSSRYPRPGVTWQPVHWSPDFPRISTSRILTRDRPIVCLFKYNKMTNENRDGFCLCSSMTRL